MNKYCVEENPYFKTKFLFKYSELVDDGMFAYFKNVKYIVVGEELEGHFMLELDEYVPNGSVHFFEAENDDAAKLMFELWV